MTIKKVITDLAKAGSKTATVAARPSQSSEVTNPKPDVSLQEYLDKSKVSLYPETVEWIDDRWVRISRPSKNVMQSGTNYTKGWKLEFNSEKRWQNWLMGWTSTGDPVSNMVVNFPTKESAIEYCEKNRLQWYVEEQPERKLRRKSYAENFSWDKRTRLGNK